MIVSGIAIAAASALSCTSNFASYDVTYAGDDRFEIEAAFQAPQTDFQMAHNPTDERPEAQSQSVRNLTAMDAAGQSTSIVYSGHGRWTAPQGAARITYELVADHSALEWPYGADEVGHAFGGGYYFAGHAFFVGPALEQTSCPVELSFSVPGDWSLTAPWASEGVNGVALSMEDLQFNGFALGPFEKTAQQIGALKLTSVYDPRLAKDVQPFVEKLLGDLLPAFANYFGGEPASDYSTFHFGYSSSDGSAFNRSFALQYEYPLNAVERPLWEHVLAHETMHLWTGVVERADHEIEWFLEGFTDYLAIKHLYREGYIDGEGLRSQLANIITRHQLGKRMSRGTSLKDAGENKGQNWFLIYGSGALIALVMDAEMSVDEPGSFDAMMADLYAAGDQSYDFAQLMSFMDERSSDRASGIFNAVDQGLRASQINTRLAPAGIGVAGRMDRSVISFGETCNEQRQCGPQFLRGEQ